MTVIICPGIHAPTLTDCFVNSMQLVGHSDCVRDWLILPTTEFPPYAAGGILTFIKKCVKNNKQSLNVTFITFSAGVVGAIGAALTWEKQFGGVRAFIALDGWGVPLRGNFPQYRLSHDWFTHWSSGLLGQGEENFYATPSVSHLELWRSPHQVSGKWVKARGCTSTTNAAEFIWHILEQHGET